MCSQYLGWQIVKYEQRAISLYLCTLVSKKSMCVMEWVASWTSCFIYGIQFFLEKTTDRESMLFLKKNGRHVLFVWKWTKGVWHFGKQLTIYVINDKIWAFKWKFKFGKLWTITMRLWVHICKGSFDKILISYTDIFQMISTWCF